MTLAKESGGDSLVRERCIGVAKHRSVTKSKVIFHGSSSKFERNLRLRIQAISVSGRGRFAGAPVKAM